MTIFFSSQNCLILALKAFYENFQNVLVENGCRKVTKKEDILGGLLDEVVRPSSLNMTKS